MAHTHTYSFQLEESVAESTRRIAHQELDVAIERLTEKLPSDPEKAVHNARKAIKRERSLVRLVRGAIPREERRHENAALRDAAQLLSGARDADVMIATVDGLSQRFAGQLPERAFTAIEAALEKDDDGHDEHTLVARAAGVTAELRAIRERTAEWEIASEEWRALDAGLVRSYMRGQKAFSTSPSITHS